MYLEQFQEHYYKSLMFLQASIQSLLEDTTLARKSDAALYEILLSCRISEYSNDLSLTAREMDRLQHQDWSASMKQKNDEALSIAGSDTNEVAQDILDLATPNKGGSAFEITSILYRQARKLADCVELPPVSRDRSGKKALFKFDAEETAEQFLKLAVEVERLLSELLKARNKAMALLGQEETLSNMLGGMSIAPHQRR